MPKIKEYYISFQKDSNMDYNENDNIITDQNKKIKINKNDLYKLFKMIKIPRDEINPYILFSFTSIKSEIVTNTIKTYKLDYNKLKKLIQYFYIQLGNKNENIEINKDSLLKIFDLLGITPNERLSLIQFFEVDEESEYYEENENEEDSENGGMSDNYSNKNINGNLNRNNMFEIKNKTKIITNKYPEENDDIIDKENIDNNINKENFDKKKKIKKKVEEKNINSRDYKKSRNKSKKEKIKYIGGKNNTIDKMEPTSLDQLKNIIDNIPSIIEEIKNKNENKKKGKEKLKKNKNKIKNNNKEPQILEIITNKIGNSSNYNNNNNYNEKIQSNNWLEEKSQTFGKYSNSSTNLNNISKYPFILPKSFEYGKSKMYLTGSIPELGNWNTKEAIPMDEELKNSQIFYTKNLDIKKEDYPFEYKFFYNKDGQNIWLGKPKVNYIVHSQYMDLYKSIQANKNIISIFDLNIRYLNKIDGYNIWDYRKQKLIQVILKYLPDVLFFQEITRPQFEYIDLNLNAVYENVGIYRDSSDNSEKCSITFNKIKYTLTDWGQFWLSSTPYTPGSNDFGNFFPRICTWALLRQINGEQFLFFNMHLDHANFSAHLPCINIVLNESEKILKNFPDTKVIFLGGCFYCEEDDEVIDKLKEKGYNEVMFENTFHDFTGEADRHWDYLFWKENFGKKKLNIELKKALVPKDDCIINLRNQQYISDHYPVLAEFIINSDDADNENNEDNYDDNKIKNNDENNELIYDKEEKKEFSEIDEDENLRQSKEFEEYEEDNDDNNNINNKEKKVHGNGEDDENEEIEVIEVEEETEENNLNNIKKNNDYNNENQEDIKENNDNNEKENEEFEEDEKKQNEEEEKKDKEEEDEHEEIEQEKEEEEGEIEEQQEEEGE